jgi:nucleolar complex protein 3
MKYLGEALNLDLQDFYTEIYRLLLPMSLDPHIDETPGSQNLNENKDKMKPAKSTLESEAELLTKGLELMFLKKRHVCPRCNDIEKTSSC